MQASLLIVSKNRKAELRRTLQILQKIIDFSLHEILVFLDGCDDGSSTLRQEFKYVKWYESEKSLGASAARAKLYSNAVGEYLIGLDDDAHPLLPDFIVSVRAIFKESDTTGIITFQEVKGVFESDEEAKKKIVSYRDEYLCNEFIGCGFAIRKDVYELTDGFPRWIDIYGEESCVALEVLSNGFDILYTNRIAVNHRVDMEARKKSGSNYFRFGKQLKNVGFYYMVYYPFPLLKILRLLLHNFTKYAVRDRVYFKEYVTGFALLVFRMPAVLKYRKPVSAAVIKKISALRSPQY